MSTLTTLIPLDALPEDPSKAAEIEHFARFVRELPRCSYLRPMLHDAVPMVASMIRNDWAFPVLADTHREQEEAVRQLAAKRVELADLNAAHCKARREYDRLEDALKALRTDARRLAQM